MFPMSSTSNGINGPNEHELDLLVRLDLVSAARRHLDFLRTVFAAQLPQLTSTLRRSIKRYHELWMPLISELSVGSTRAVLVPALDIQWVWHCHTLNPVSYKKYCESRFSKILEKPWILDDANEEYALNRCRNVWSNRYPLEPFELETVDDDDEVEIATDEEIYKEVEKHKDLYSKFSEPYMSETVYLISAKERYRRFLYLLRRLKDGCFRFVPTLDIQLMWLTHQSYPMIYAEDMKSIEGDLGKVVGVWDLVKDEDVEETKKVWVGLFDQPYEKAGAMVDGVVGPMKSSIYWDVWDVDVNTKYRSMVPRLLSEVCVFLRRNNETQHQESKMTKQQHDSHLRLGTVRCHKQLKLETPITSIPSHTWQKMSHLYWEFTTRGVILDLKLPSRKTCFRTTSSKVTKLFLWNDLLRGQNLTLGTELGRQVKVVASITPPAQAPYLIKCVPDCVTDNSGAMISDVVLRMNGYRPQEGRWLSRTVLDHAGRECFVVRIRVGDGFWRRGGETPKAVKREDRVIEVREGTWTYVAGSIGRAPEKVVGTATPKQEESREQRASWSMSTGDELTIQWTSSGLTFHLHNHTSLDEVRLLRGRKMQYQVNKPDSNNKQDQEEEEEFVTLVRYTPENPRGRATALLNWRLLLMEISPEEDAVMVLMVSIAIVRSVSEMMREDVGRLLVRRRLKEPKLGLRDWGSVVLHPSCFSSNSVSSMIHLQPWYWNAKAVMASVEADDNTRQSTFSSSPAEGGDKLYKQVIIPSS